MNKKHTALEARNADGQTVAMMKYTGTTSVQRCTETDEFMKKWQDSSFVVDFKHHGDEVWVVKNLFYKDNTPTKPKRGSVKVTRNPKPYFSYGSWVNWIVFGPGKEEQHFNTKKWATEFAKCRRNSVNHSDADRAFQVADI